MPKLKLDKNRTLLTDGNCSYLFTVHIKVKYGWTGDLDTTLLVLANTHEQARRAAAARLVIKEGISLPLDDNHFSETLVGQIDRAPAEPEMSREEFSRLWSHVDVKFKHHAHQSDKKWDDQPDEYRKALAKLARPCACGVGNGQRSIADPSWHHSDCDYRRDCEAIGKSWHTLPAQD